MRDRFRLTYRVGIVGLHGYGKTTGADMLATELAKYGPGLIVKRNDMAKALRSRLERSLPQPLNPMEKVHPLERNALQFTGEMWRNVDRNTWLMHALEDRPEVPHRDEPSATVQVFSDVYHFNEMFAMDHLVLLVPKDPNWIKEYAVGKYIDDEPSTSLPLSIYETACALRWYKALLYFMPYDSVYYRFVDGPQDFANEGDMKHLSSTLIEEVNSRLKKLGRSDQLLSYQGGSNVSVGSDLNPVSISGGSTNS